MTTIRYSLTALDCPAPLELAAFYAALTGLDVEPLGDFPAENVSWIELVDGDRSILGFQKIPFYVKPTWPEGPTPQQLHLDFNVDDLDAGEAHALAQGATKADFQPAATEFRVFFDPIGHPFCLVKSSN